MKSVEIRIGEATVSARLDPGGAVEIGAERFEVTPMAAGLYRVSDGTRQWTVAVADGDDERWVFVEGRVARLEVASEGARGRQGRRRKTAGHDLTAPMPATVIRVLAGPGTAVARGDTVLMLEAMKMELPVRAPHDGVVRAVHCAAGDLVQPGTRLMDIE